MKKVIAAICSLFLAAASAFAAPGAVVNPAGTVVYGASETVSAKPGASTCTVRYTGAGSTVAIADDASNTRCTKIIASYGTNGVAASDGTTFNIAKSNGIYCTSSQSVIGWPNIGSAQYLADGCAFWQAAKTAAAAP